MKKRKVLFVTSALMASMLAPTTVSAENWFTDVPSNKYYAAPIAWAVKEGYANGITSNLFKPEKVCSRGDLMTMLYNIVGDDDQHPAYFTDVPSNKYYFKPVNWAVDRGIAGGKSDTLFAPNEGCTRGQAVAFLWREEGEPEAASQTDFTDVKSGDYYYDAVNWAVSQGVASGKSKTRFDPNGACTRGDILTYLYRMAGSPNVTVPKTSTRSVSEALSKYKSIVASAPTMKSFESGGSIAGEYMYSLVQLKSGEGPTLLLAQKTTDNSTYNVKGFYYDLRDGNLYETKNSILFGIGGTSFRASLALEGDGNGLMLLSWSPSDPTIYLERYVRNGNSFVKEDETITQMGSNSGISSRTIQWYNISDDRVFNNWPTIPKSTGDNGFPNA